MDHLGHCPGGSQDYISDQNYPATLIIGSLTRASQEYLLLKDVEIRVVDKNCWCLTTVPGLKKPVYFCCCSFALLLSCSIWKDCFKKKKKWIQGDGILTGQSWGLQAECMGFNKCQSALGIAVWPPGIQPDPKLDCPETGKISPWQTLLRIAAARELPGLSLTSWALLKLIFVYVYCISGFSKDPSSSGFPASI